MCKLCFLQNALFTFSETLLSNQAENVNDNLRESKTILYEDEADTIFFLVMIVKSSLDSQMTLKTAAKFWIPQMTVLFDFKSQE